MGMINFALASLLSRLRSIDIDNNLYNNQYISIKEFLNIFLFHFLKGIHIWF